MAAFINAIVIVDQLLLEVAVQYRDGKVGLPESQIVLREELKAAMY